MKLCRTRTPTPVSRLGWHDFYARRFNTTHSPQAAHLATWYLLLHYALDADVEVSHV